MLSQAHQNNLKGPHSGSLVESVSTGRTEFFGSAGNRLLGVLFKTTDDSPKGAVLVCHPLGHEYLRSYHVLNNLCELLANSGYHAMHFDYSGTGDSDRSLLGVRLKDWQNDLRVASQYLRASTNVQTQHLLAVRSGALVALSIKLEQTIGITLWDPIANGDQWFLSQRRLQDKTIAQFDRFLWRQRNIHPQEIFGYQFSEDMINDLATLDLLHQRNILSKNLTIFSSQTDQPIEPDEASIRAELFAGKCTVQLPEPCSWDSVTNPESPLNASIAEFICRRFRYGSD